MKVTGFKTWRLEVDSAPWYFGNPIPKDEPLKWEYPLTRVSTDEDIHGYTMGYGANGEGRIDSCILHDLYVDALVGEDPFQHEAIWQVFKRKNRHLYSLTDTAIWNAGRSPLGHQRQSHRPSDRCPVGRLSK